MVGPRPSTSGLNTGVQQFLGGSFSSAGMNGADTDAVSGLGPPRKLSLVSDPMLQKTITDMQTDAAYDQSSSVMADLPPLSMPLFGSSGDDQQVENADPLAGLDFDLSVDEILKLLE